MAFLTVFLADASGILAGCVRWSIVLGCGRFSTLCVTSLTLASSSWTEALQAATMPPARTRTRSDSWFLCSARTHLARSVLASTVGMSGISRSVSRDSAIMSSSRRQSRSAWSSSAASHRRSTMSPLALRSSWRENSTGSKASMAASTDSKARKKGFQRRSGLCAGAAMAANLELAI
jgi:hypothetical protein